MKVLCVKNSEKVVGSSLYLDRMQVSTRPGGEGGLNKHPSPLKSVCEVSNVVRSQKKNIQFWQFGVCWDRRQSSLQKKKKKDHEQQQEEEDQEQKQQDE